MIEDPGYDREIGTEYSLTRGRDRRAFLSFFVLTLAIAAGAFFATVNHVPQMVWADPVARWFGGAIGLLFLAGVAKLGRQAWISGDADFGHFVIGASPALGMLGTVVGLCLVFKNIGSPAALAGGAVAFYSTGCGLVSMILTKALVYVVERGARS